MYVDCGTAALSWVLELVLERSSWLHRQHSQTSFFYNNIAGHVGATSLSCGHHRGVFRFVHRPSDMLLSPSSSSRLLPVALLSVFLTSVTPSQTLIPAFPEGCPYIAENCTRLELLPVQRADSCHQNIAAGFAQEIAAADDAQVCHCCNAFRPRSSVPLLCIPALKKSSNCV